MFTPSSEANMRRALELAHEAQKIGEVPVGAVVVREDRVIAGAFNRKESDLRPTAHAELLAIEAACQSLGAWRLEATQLYVTLEPCIMCWGAILQARIPTVYFGAADPKAGVCGSVLQLHETPRFNHHPQVFGGLLARECGQILSEFFSDLRGQKKDLAMANKNM